MSGTIIDVEIRFTRGSRKHRIGRAHARYVIATTKPGKAKDTETQVMVWTWIGLDDRGLELEIVAIERPDCLLVIHVMPTELRK